MPFLWTVLLVVTLSTAASLIFWRTLRGWSADASHEKLVRETRPAASDLDGAGFGAVGAFDLTDHEGKPFGRASLEGRVWIADFVFTYCSGPCPAMSAEIQKIRDELASESDLHFVSFSVDPLRDTPEVLRGYVERYGGAGDRWHLLTGQPAAIYTVARESFHAAAGGGETLGDPDAVTHSTLFFLVDRDGVVRGRYRLGEPAELAALRADAKACLRRARKR